VFINEANKFCKALQQVLPLKERESGTVCGGYEDSLAIVEGGQLGRYCAST